MDISINKVQNIYVFKSSNNQGSCGCCKEKLQDPCIECKQYQHSNCEIATGKCEHSFHYHCITFWLQNQNTCPFCTQQWDFK